MGYVKDQLIQQMEEEREDLIQTLDDIEAFGEKHAWSAASLASPANASTGVSPTNVLRRRVKMARLPFKSNILQRMLMGKWHLGQWLKIEEFAVIKLQENILVIARS
ncbi:hypothetical protein CPLU01_14757 [Colletotrichum plurivorum]|uniref:Uncharacterized protein n=1 Tax=Colletotrichum plurivorum TaxID=2175906 RepID=A0A8H6JI15_9PEZI|nr:hypothetical protein CPLU01_14757 [Colletotrichum plurivorum]